MREIDTKVRKIRADELQYLLELYDHLHENDIPRPSDSQLNRVWKEVFDSKSTNIYVVERKKKIVSSCVLTIIPNLTRGARPYALIENMITHPDYRRLGFAIALLRHVINQCKIKNCYKIMLLSSKSRDRAHNLYKKGGFNNEEKYGFVLNLKDDNIE
ncbi:MAG: GNAT family N-acetyltransferase [Candidatus Lokiarchaeota archaeon]|nr:GNAT family N-acetyltransferase [Candidatus Lokiarchaeota archaeon]MBD3341770.1 GNAT family N-acetyltransferase [Candidatus Lokiarchaeota archaeon]